MKKILLIGGVFFFIGCGINVNLDKQVFKKNLTEAKLLHKNQIEWNVNADNVNEHYSDVENGKTILHQVIIASSFDIDKKLKIIDFLLMRGADVNIKDENGKTPLFYTIEEIDKFFDKDSTFRKNPRKIAIYLLKHKADPLIADKNGITPFKLALEKQEYEIILAMAMYKKGILEQLDDKTKTIILNKALQRKTDINLDPLINKENINKPINGMTPLLIAVASNRDLDFIKYLISKGADIKTIDKSQQSIIKSHYKNSLLHYAVLNKNLELIKYFVTSGIDVNVQNARGRTPLHLAAISTLKSDKNSIEIIKYLLLKANRNIKDVYGYIPLYYAIYHLNLENTSLLLNQDLNNIERFVDLIMPYLIKYKKIHYIGYLKDNKKNTLLHIAIKSNDLKGVEALLKNVVVKMQDQNKIIIYSTGIDFNTKNDDGETPIDIAIKNHQNQFIDFFIPKYMNKIKQKNLLHKAVFYSNIDAVSKLSNYFNVNSIDKNGNTPLLFAKNKKIIDLLLSHGAKINHQNKNGDTILHLMIKSKNYDIAEYLVLNGANLYLKNKNENTPFDLLSNQQLKEKFKIYYLTYVANNGDFEEIKKLTESNPNLVYFIKDERLRLALTGPKGLKVGDIRKMIKKGRSNKLIVSLIKRVKEPYKQFSLEEIDVLIEMGLNEDVISAMVDVTTELLKDKKRKEEQEYYLKQQKKLLTQHPIIKEKVKVIYRDNPKQNKSNPMVDKLQDKLIDKGVDEAIRFIDKLF